MNWIDIRKRRPKEDGRRILVCDSVGDVTIEHTDPVLRYDGKTWSWRKSYTFGNGASIRYWMELPAAPREFDDWIYNRSFPPIE